MDTLAAPLPRREEYRARHRAARKPSKIRGWRHFYLILAAGAAATTACALLLENVKAWEWLMIPVGFVVANFVEWFMHKGPMHHPTKPVRVMYERHTLEHHAFFTHDAMAAEPEDFDAVLFSVPSLIFFFGGTGLPLALLVYWTLGWNAAWIFAAMCVDYYVLYECFHTAYHLPEDHWSGRLPFMASRKRHHALHHAPRYMTQCNFNVTFPIFDGLFGTLRG